MRNDFGVIIISHGRPECETVKTLRASGYSGNIYIVVDDEDKTKDEYIRLYGDHVHIFHKTDDFDLGDLGGTKSVGVYARNECLKVAKEKGLTYYLELDDDMQALNFRYNDDEHLRGKKVHSFDKIAEAICKYFDKSNVQCLGFGNAVDYIGGVPTFESERVGRNCLNSFFLRTKNDFTWLGRHSDDIITIISEAQKGKAGFRYKPIMNVFDVWLPTKKSKKEGGSIQAYNNIGSYKLRFYAVMYHPDCIKLKQSEADYEVSISSNNAYPQILSSRYKKGQ